MKIIKQKHIEIIKKSGSIPCSNDLSPPTTLSIHIFLKSTTHNTASRLGGVGSSCYISSGKKQVSRNSHLPSHYIRKHAASWLLVRFTMPDVCKTKLSALVSMRPHCSVHMPEAISLHVSWMKLNGLGRPYRFYSVWHTSSPPSLQQALCVLRPLTSQPFVAEWHTFCEELSAA